MESKKVIAELHAELERYRLLGIATKESRQKAAALDAMADSMTKKLSELEDFGLVIKDLDLGLVDFPAERYGEKVLLCWRYGEQEVLFWHKPLEGFRRRKPLNVQAIPR
jgi:hypothetical protein